MSKTKRKTSNTASSSFGTWARPWHLLPVILLLCGALAPGEKALFEVHFWRNFFEKFRSTLRAIFRFGLEGKLIRPNERGQNSF
ncbi:DE-cadherin isoform X2 [Vespula squamosa]|uniref:DE-cadherin isoform X2 n=1 Tax=Vespula squamosa TaxID=30214 RepID=A0ABD2ADJ0_VESSQ